MNDPFDVLRDRGDAPPVAAGEVDPGFRRALLAAVRDELAGDGGGQSRGRRWRALAETPDPHHLESVIMPSQQHRRPRLLLLAACLVLAVAGIAAIAFTLSDDDPPAPAVRPDPTTVTSDPIGSDPTESSASPTTVPATTTTAPVLITAAPSPTTQPASTSTTVAAPTGVAIAATDDAFVEFEGSDVFGDVAAGFGSVWVPTLEGLIEIDPATAAAVRYDDLAPARDIVTAFDSVWTLNGDRGILSRIDPVTKAVIAEIEVPGNAQGFVATDRDLIVTQFAGGNALRVDPVTNSVVETIEVVQQGVNGPREPAYADGETWFAVPNQSAVARVAGDGQVTLFEAPGRVGNGRVVITESYVWVPGGGFELTRVDRATGEVTMVQVSPDGLTRGFNAAVVIEGTLWLAMPGAMVAIDDDGAVLGTVPRRGADVRAAVVAGDRVWVMSENPGSLEAIPVATFTAAI